MFDERKRILTHRIVWAVILFIVLLIPLFTIKNSNNLKIVKDEAYIVDYYSSIDETACEVYITFNMEVYGGDVTIEFYDSSDNLIDTTTSYFFGYGNKAEDTYLIVNGKVDSYKIISYSINIDTSTTVTMFAIFYVGVLPFAIAFLVASLLVNFKKYDLEGNEMIIYAGFYHHYIKINGEKYDEHNTLVSLVAILLSCEFNGNTIESTISLTNRISTKLNGKLLNNIK